MEIHQLKYFVALSQELHFLRASQKAHVSQPTLSQQIKKLEVEFGAVLFERSPKHVRLTEAGKKFLPRAISVLETLESAKRELETDGGEISGILKVGAIPTMGPYLFPPVIARIKKEAPRLKLELFEETTSNLLLHLKEGRLDLAILSLPIEAPGIVSKSIGQEPFFVAASKHHTIAVRKKISLKELAKEPLLILQEGHCFSDQALEYCKRSRQDAQVIFQGSSLGSVMRLAAAGEGVTFVPKMAVEKQESGGLAFIPFTEPSPARHVAVAWRVSAPLGRAHQYFMDVLKEKTGELIRR